MKLGFVSAILPELSLEQVLQFASEAGFDCVELMCWPVGKAERRYAGVTHLDVTGFTKTQARQALELAASAGVCISALGYYPNLLSFDLQEAEIALVHLREVIVAAHLLSVNVVNTFVGRDPALSVE